MHVLLGGSRMMVGGQSAELSPLGGSCIIEGLSTGCQPAGFKLVLFSSTSVFSGRASTTLSCADLPDLFLTFILSSSFITFAVAVLGFEGLGFSILLLGGHWPNSAGLETCALANADLRQ